MENVRLEVFVEPFKENAPGAHVVAVVDALRAVGLDPEMGPIATTATGDIETVARALKLLTSDSFTAGAQAIQIHLEKLS